MNAQSTKSQTPVDLIFLVRATRNRLAPVGSSRSSGLHVKRREDVLDARRLPARSLTLFSYGQRRKRQSVEPTTIHSFAHCRDRNRSRARYVGSLVKSGMLGNSTWWARCQASFCFGLGNARMDLGAFRSTDSQVLAFDVGRLREAPRRQAAGIFAVARWIANLRLPAHLSCRCYLRPSHKESNRTAGRHHCPVGKVAEQFAAKTRHWIGEATTAPLQCVSCWENSW